MNKLRIAVVCLCCVQTSYAISITPAMADVSCLGYTGPRTSQLNTDSDNDGIVDSSDMCIGSIPGQLDINVETGCPTDFEPSADLSFDKNDPKHELWYQHFWDGKCSGLSLLDFCTPGHPWASYVNQLDGQLNAELLRAQLWAAGRFIGFEWARNNDIRRIDTNDIKGWGNRLKTAADNDSTTEIIQAELAMICVEAEQKVLGN